MDDYIEQADTFLTASGTTLHVSLAPIQSAPLWVFPGDKYGYKYDIVLENQRGKYAFAFWNSLYKREAIDAVNQLASDNAGMLTVDDYRARDILKEVLGKNITRAHARRAHDALLAELAPTSYDILAALDQLHAESFEDFCAEFGYDEDSRRAFRTYRELVEQDRRLRQLFNHDELEQLAEIC